MYSVIYKVLNAERDAMSSRMSHEEIIRGLYSSLKKDSLPDPNGEETYYFDEGTGTYYMLTGKAQMDRPNIELAKKYFENAIIPLRKAPAGSDDFQKALYCAIAVECIDRLLKEGEKNKHHKKT